MDKLKEKIKTEKSRENNKRLLRILLGGASRCDSEGKRALVESAVLFTLGALFSRSHLIFGAHPLALALISVMPYGVFASTVGAIAGALSLGKSGIIYAMTAVITLFIRVIISGGQKRDTGELFLENILLRMSSATVAGFVAAVYEVLLSGLSELSILFGVSMILIPPVLTFILSGLFNTGIDIQAVIVGDPDTLSLNGKRDEEKYNVIFFDISALVALFLIAHSLYGIELFGISAAFIFVPFITLITAKRLGAIRAMATGFVAGLGSGIISVSFALLGLVAGVLLPFGIPYALIASGTVMSLWSGYVAGLGGTLSILPEFIIASALVAPLLKRLRCERGEKEQNICESTARDMVGTMALSYQNRYTGALDLLETSLSALSTLMHSHTLSHKAPSIEEYERIVSEAQHSYCLRCESRELCTKENVCPAVKGAHLIAQKLARREEIFPEDVNRSTEFCQHAKEIAETIRAEAARAEQDNLRISDNGSSAEEYELISKLINEARLRDDEEKAVDHSVTEALEKVIRSHGLYNGVIRAFGKRRRHVILAAEDESGDIISSRELRRDIESALSQKLTEPEYFRQGKMAVFECDSKKSYAVECACALRAADSEEVSGDTVACYESRSGYYYALLSDGMGKGELAKETSQFVTGFIKRVMDFAPSFETVLHLLNHVMRHSSEECSATVDLFEIDLYTLDATFIKSGAAPSFIKRDSSLFRIRSQTAPIGLVKGIDTERIKVEIKCDDYVIILSDGVIQSAEDEPWLLELLAKPADRNLQKYAEQILAAAEKNSRSRDDMSVTVLKVIRV